MKWLQIHVFKAEENAQRIFLNLPLSHMKWGLLPGQWKCAALWVMSKPLC